MIKGIGIDMVKIARVKLTIARRILTPEELILLKKHHQPQVFLASRFCLKEAIIKATNKKYSFLDINITNNLDGGLVANINNLYLSLSHEQEYCIAMCIWEE